jgi:cell fate regulator YaaT (PSP1 superfamily)
MRAVAVKSTKMRVYYSNCHNLELTVGENIIVKTEEGLELGTIVSPPQEMETGIPSKDKGSVVRKAGEIDFEQEERRHQTEREAFKFCRNKISYYNLPMKLIDVECLFDGSKIIFYFTAKQRVDFRRLLKELILRLHTRIEMQQIGARTESKMIGGMGICGQILCCARFLPDFEPVSIKMAKNQSLSLNPAKISGVCGKLMCCLNYEHKIYLDLKKELPECGKIVSTNLGTGKIVEQNIIENKLCVQLDEGKKVELRPDELEEKGS